MLKINAIRVRSAIGELVNSVVIKVKANMAAGVRRINRRQITLNSDSESVPGSRSYAE